FSVATDPSIANQVPADVKNSGKLTVAADASYPPDESFASDGTTVIGMDADLAKAIADVMGLKAEVQNQTFETIIAGIAAGKVSLGISSITDRQARETQADFVTYAAAGESFFVNTLGGYTIISSDAMRGVNLGAEKGTTEADDAFNQSRNFADACNAALDVGA